jgi:hypothetical protein
MPVLLPLLPIPAPLDAAAAAVTGSAMESAGPALLLHAARWCTGAAAESWCNLSTHKLSQLSTHKLSQLLRKTSKQLLLLLQPPAAAATVSQISGQRQAPQIPR